MYSHRSYVIGYRASSIGHPAQRQAAGALVSYFSLLVSSCNCPDGEKILKTKKYVGQIELHMYNTF
jgi:hypothetical protein